MADLLSGTTEGELISCGRTGAPNARVERGTKLLATFCIKIYLGGEPPSLFGGFNFGSGTDRMIFCPGDPWPGMVEVITPSEVDIGTAFTTWPLVLTGTRSNGA